MIEDKICDLDPVIAMLANPEVPLADVGRELLVIQTSIVKDLEIRYRVAYEQRPSLALTEMLKVIGELQRSIRAAEARSRKENPESLCPKFKFTL